MDQFLRLVGEDEQPKASLSSTERIWREQPVSERWLFRGQDTRLAFTGKEPRTWRREASIALQE